VIPPKARTVRMRTWGGGDGVFWQLGGQIGVEWLTLPEWGDQATPGVCSKSWTLPETTARRWIDLLEASTAISYHRP
jgi:hypothetical protein